VKVFLCGDNGLYLIKAVEYLKAKGHAPINPYTLPDGLCNKDKVELQMDILRCCDAIYLLKGWSFDSTYYRQYTHAVELGLQISKEEI
jgi:hypothetical protein